MPQSKPQAPTRRIQTAFQLILYEITTGPWHPNEHKTLLDAWHVLRVPILAGHSAPLTDIEEMAQLNQTQQAADKP